MFGKREESCDTADQLVMFKIGVIIIPVQVAFSVEPRDVEPRWIPSLLQLLVVDRNVGFSIIGYGSGIVRSIYEDNLRSYINLRSCCNSYLSFARSSTIRLPSARFASCFVSDTALWASSIAPVCIVSRTF